MCRDGRLKEALFSSPPFKTTSCAAAAADCPLTEQEALVPVAVAAAVPLPNPVH